MTRQPRALETIVGEDGLDAVSKGTQPSTRQSRPTKPPRREPLGGDLSRGTTGDERSSAGVLRCNGRRGQKGQTSLTKKMIFPRKAVCGRNWLLFLVCLHDSRTPQAASAETWMTSPPHPPFSVPAGPLSRGGLLPFMF